MRSPCGGEDGDPLVVVPLDVRVVRAAGDVRVPACRSSSWA